MTDVFAAKAPGVMKALIERFALSPVQAAGILGNIGVECNGFRNLREIGQPEGRGGYGWCQWTADRRRKFLAFCGGSDWRSDECNLGYLIEELSGPFKRAITMLHTADDMGQAVMIFERNFEMAAKGQEHFDRRVQWGDRALQAWKGAYG